MIIGPSAAGLLAAAGLLHGAMLIDALTFLVSLASLAGVRRRYRPAGTAGAKAVAWRALGQELAEGIRYLAATRLLLTLLVFLLTLNLCLGADKLIIFLGKDTLHLPPGQVGFLVTAGGVGGLAGAAGTGRLCRWLAPLPVVALCCAGSGLALVLISVATAMPVLLAGNFLYTWAIVAASVTMRSLRQVLVPRDLLGRVTASWAARRPDGHPRRRCPGRGPGGPARRQPQAGNRGGRVPHPPHRRRGVVCRSARRRTLPAWRSGCWESRGLENSPGFDALACSRLGVRPDETVFIDDTDYCVAGRPRGGHARRPLPGQHAGHPRDRGAARQLVSVPRPYDHREPVAGSAGRAGGRVGYRCE